MLWATVGGESTYHFYNQLNSHVSQKFGKGLDEVHPFSDTSGVDVLLRAEEMILSPKWELVGSKNAGRIWGFISKFVMLDRFAKTLGAADVYPGIVVPRKMCSNDYLGTGLKVRPSFLNCLTFLI